MAFAFDPARFFNGEGARFGHGAAIGIGYRAHGPDWCELDLPYAAQLVGDPESGVIASGPILTMMDMAASIAVWNRAGFTAHATLDLRVDYLRPATPGETLVGRGECYRVTHSVAFVRGVAHHGDPDDPIAHVAGTFMAPGGYHR
ncbi:PaaI family thioesterase [Sphingomonas aracearum]|uniref:PaaI family thioesterase n=1 Tax=Sphingomonas aracearum TaxID=2283317 RepID=A0A369W4Y9_9SPHN|nr:PaaI family thioesterase [Sphingomonas aracearum]RDE07121.1 PaaI family thioesterase [Sphingomonas aracearum]